MTTTFGDQIAALWFEVTGQQWDADLHRWFAEQAERSTVLRSAPHEVIEQVGRSHFLAHNSLLMPAWEEQVALRGRAIQRYRASTFAADQGLDYPTWYARRDAIVALDRLWDQDALDAQMTGHFSRRVIREAHALLLERVMGGPITTSSRLAPLRYRPHMSHPVAEDLPCVAADEREIVVLHLLALTYPTLQFFYNGRSEPVPGYRNGNHRNSPVESTPVPGMSVILDALAAVMREHRWGAGGRIYISRGEVICPRHRHTIATIRIAESRGSFGSGSPVCGSEVVVTSR